MSRKRKRREPDNDGDQNMPEPEQQVIVRCVACHVLHNTTLRAFTVRGCVCPKCGESKAQLISVEASKPGVEKEPEEE